MGGAITKPLEAQQAKMAEAQNAMIARQLEMQQVMRERMVATQIAMARDMLRFYGVVYGFALVGLSAGAVVKRNPAMLAPLVPLSAVLAYQYDLAYHTKMDRVVAEAEAILLNERHLLALPGGALTVASVDASIAARVNAAQALAPAALK